MKFNIKHLMAVSAIALAMIGAGGVINANKTNVHADDTSVADALLNAPSAKKDFKEDEKADAEDERVAASEDEPNRKQDALDDMQNDGMNSDLANDPVIRHFLHKHGYTNHQIKASIEGNEDGSTDKGTAYTRKVNKENARLAHKAAKSNWELAHSHNPDINNNYTKRHYRKGIKRYHHKQATKRTNRKLASHKAKRSRKISKRGSKRTNKKLVNSIKYDKKVLANKHARYFDRLIKRVNSKHIRKSTKRYLSKKINRKANRKYLNAYKNLVKDQKLLK